MTKRNFWAYYDPIFATDRANSANLVVYPRKSRPKSWLICLKTYLLALRDFLKSVDKEKFYKKYTKVSSKIIERITNRTKFYHAHFNVYIEKNAPKEVVKEFHSIKRLVGRKFIGKYISPPSFGIESPWEEGIRMEREKMVELIEAFHDILKENNISYLKDLWIAFTALPTLSVKGKGAFSEARAWVNWHLRLFKSIYTEDIGPIVIATAPRWGDNEGARFSCEPVTLERIRKKYYGEELSHSELLQAIRFHLYSRYCLIEHYCQFVDFVIELTKRISEKLGKELKILWYETWIPSPKELSEENYTGEALDVLFSKEILIEALDWGPLRERLKRKIEKKKVKLKFLPSYARFIGIPRKDLSILEEKLNEIGLSTNDYPIRKKAGHFVVLIDNILDLFCR